LIGSPATGWPTAKHVSEAIEGVGGMFNALVAPTFFTFGVLAFRLLTGKFPRAGEEFNHQIKKQTTGRGAMTPATTRCRR